MDMLTNALQLLHTTAGYQAAAMQLMVGEANFAASALEIEERVPPVATGNTNEWMVNPVPYGLGGGVCSSNYTFDFSKGKLRSVNKYHWFQKISPPVTGLAELAERPSLLDTNSAYDWRSSDWLPFQWMWAKWRSDSRSGFSRCRFQGMTPTANRTACRK